MDYHIHYYLRLQIKGVNLEQHLFYTYLISLIIGVIDVDTYCFTLFLAINFPFTTRWSAQVSNVLLNNVIFFIILQRCLV